MAPFVRRYACYVLARISSYRSVGYDFAKVKRELERCVMNGHPGGRI
jgi:hypothetical protein